MTKWTANFILLMIAATWCYLSVTKGFIVAVSDQFIWICGILVTGNIGDALATTWKGGNPRKPVDPPKE